jgi:hypothetical protein
LDRDRGDAAVIVVTQGEMGQAVEALQSEAKSRMRTILRTRSLRGCPVNIPFTDVEDVVTQVILVVIFSY